MATQAGVSKSLLNDILNDRSFGADEKRRAIAGALGYDDYEAFLDIGRKLVKIPPVRQAPKSKRKTVSADELIELLRENRILRQEIDSLKMELENVKNELRSLVLEEICDPSVRGIPDARGVAENDR